MAGKLRVEDDAAGRMVYRGEGADRRVATGAEGTRRSLPRQAPLVSLLSMVEMRVKRGREEDSLTIFGGFLEVANNVVRVLADVAERAEEIDLARAEEARQRALARLRERRADIDRQRAEMALRRSTIRIAVARKRRARPAPGGPPLPEAQP